MKSQKTDLKSPSKSLFIFLLGVFIAFVSGIPDWLLGDLPGFAKIDQWFFIFGLGLSALALPFLFPLKIHQKVIAEFYKWKELITAIQAVQKSVTDFLDRHPLWRKKILLLFRISVVVFFSVFFIEFAWLRFYKLKKIGMSGYDTFIYASAAKDWTDGKYVNRYGKIGFDALGAVAVKTFGYRDYTNRFLVAFSDSLNSIFIFTSGLLIGLSPLSSLAASILYASMPIAIEYGRFPLSASSTTLWLLISFYLFFWYLKRSNKSTSFLFLFGSGFAVCFSGLVHPMVFSMPLYFGIVMMLVSMADRSKPLYFKLAKLLMSGIAYAAGAAAAIFGIAAFAAAASLQKVGALQTAQQIFEILVRDSVLHSESAMYSHLGRFGVALQSSQVFLSILHDKTLLFAKVISVVFILILIRERFSQAQKLKKSKNTSPSLKDIAFLLGAVGWFLSFFVLQNLKQSDPRYYLPLIPALILALCCIFEFILKSWKPWVRGLVLFLFSIMVARGAIKNIWGSYQYSALHASMYRQAANEFLCKGLPSGRILIAPSTLINDYEFFSFYLRPIPFRLKPNWDPETLPQYIKQYQIRYVIVAKNDLIDPHRYKDIYGYLKAFTAQTFTYSRDYRSEKEIASIQSVLQKMQAKIIHDTPALMIYEIAEQKSQLPSLKLSDFEFVPDILKQGQVDFSEDEFGSAIMPVMFYDALSRDAYPWLETPVSDLNSLNALLNFPDLYEKITSYKNVSLSEDLKNFFMRSYSLRQKPYEAMDPNMRQFIRRANRLFMEEVYITEAPKSLHETPFYQARFIFNQVQLCNNKKN